MPVRARRLELGEEAAIQMAKAVMAEEIVTVLQEVEPMVEGRSRTERLAIYEEGLDICVSSMLAGM